MSAVYNDYVLSASLEVGWITDEQAESVRLALNSIPGLAALDYMTEQQILTTSRAKRLRDMINDAEKDHQTAAGSPSSAGLASGITTDENSGPYSHVRDYLHYALQCGASDVHLSPDARPIMRISGQLIAFPDFPMLTRTQTEALGRGFLTSRQAETVDEMGSIDFCYEVSGSSRYRSSVVRQRRGWEMVFRIISSRIKTMDDLGLPDTLKVLTQYHNGLILVTGSVGSGKSTTLAAMVEQINQERKDHIITLEDPIEYVFTPKGCQISQREIHTHTNSFGTALRAALREDPDVIMVGEMRDLETIQLAITASETGHLVLGTLHTSTAARTLDRLLDVFPIEQQAQIRTMVSESIRGIVCQQLVPRLDGNGRVLALEVMLNTPAVGSLIRDAKTFMLPGVMQTGRKMGMRLIDDSLIELVDQGIIGIEEAMHRAENKKTFTK